MSSSLFEDASNFNERYIPGYASLTAKVAALRELDCRIVLTSGSFDIIHEGHSLYLEAARAWGDFLIVGVDSDAKITARKGKGRPIVPEMERLRMVTHQRGVGLVTLKCLGHTKWELVQAVHPDILVATADTYTAKEIALLEDKYCNQVEILERMATVSTTARLRDVIRREHGGA